MHRTEDSLDTTVVVPAGQGPTIGLRLGQRARFCRFTVRRNRRWAVNLDVGISLTR
jgi:hypothetical protein